jgi:hypothetical protein
MVLSMFASSMCRRWILIDFVDASRYMHVFDVGASIWDRCFYLVAVTSVVAVWRFVLLREIRVVNSLCYAPSGSLSLF